MKDYIEVEGIHSAVQVNVKQITHFHPTTHGCKIYVSGSETPIVVKDSYTKLQDLISNR